jgi:hypothetical protein
MSCPWSAYAPASIAFCEARECAWVVEPSNAWSNLAYVLCGLVILGGLARRSAPLRLIGVAAIAIGLGSFAFHGTGTRVGELIDVSAMYLLSCLALVFAARRLWSLSGGALLLLYLVLVGSSVLVMIVSGSNGIFMFAGQITVAVLTELYLYMKRPRWASYGAQQAMIASFTLAFAIWNADKWDLLCRPDNHFITGHAVWHVLTAVAIYAFARQQAGEIGTQSGYD